MGIRTSLLLMMLLAAVLPAAERLWYEAPAKVWTEALPVGNGRLGAMVFGGVAQERIQFNEQTLWTGDEVVMGAYQPFGDLLIRQDAGEPTGYRRHLDLDTATTETRWTTAGVTFTRTVWCSHPARMLVVRLGADQPGRISARIQLTDQHGAGLLTAGGRLLRQGRLDNGLAYESQLIAVPEGGTSTIAGEELVINATDGVTLLLAAGTSFVNDPTQGWRGEDPHAQVTAWLDAAAAQPPARLLAEHVADHQRLYRRVALDLGPSRDDLPTDRRIQEARAELGHLKQPAFPSGDPGLEALLFAYGRYLLIASSRPGGLPANLQGLWNQDLKPAWYCGYTTNINIQMNYWPAEPTNLSECHEPLFNWVNHLAAVRRKGTQPSLRTDQGWIINCTNNPMGGNSTWVLHRPGSAWLSQHFWTHYEFTGDRTFLEQQAYPLLRDLVRYWQGHLVPGPEGRLITPDGWSPEHGPVRKLDGTVVIVEGNRAPQPGASYDQQIVYDLCTNFLAAAAVLDVDPVLRGDITAMRQRLLGPRIGRWGQLQEWLEDVDDPEDRNRHVSHLFAVHPGRQIDPLTTPELAQAARVSLTARGPGPTGWSRAWRINLWARLGDGNEAHRILRYLLLPAAGGRSGVYPNLFDAHPPFQIDGNFGATAGIAEMLIQSQVMTETGYLLHLLPALPKAWPAGQVRGLRVRGDGTIAMTWRDGALVTAEVQADRHQRWAVRSGDRTWTIEVPAGATRSLLDAQPRP